MREFILNLIKVLQFITINFIKIYNTFKTINPQINFRNLIQFKARFKIKLGKRY